MTEYQFTKDWFNWAPEVWNQLIPMLPERTDDGRNFLEIGSFEGRSAVWIAENMMQKGDTLTCIDTWRGGEEHSEEDMVAVYERFTHNMQLLQTKKALGLSVCVGTSTQELAHWLVEESDQYQHFDFIYIDGSHVAKDVLTDACMAWPLLKLNGMMVFDDYMWGNPRDALHRPKIAIDAFTTIFGETAEIVHVGYQLVVRKKGE
jgi:predicted O-methyltransferase YrrM